MYKDSMKPSIKLYETMFFWKLEHSARWGSDFLSKKWLRNGTARAILMGMPYGKLQKTWLDLSELVLYAWRNFLHALCRAYCTSSLCRCGFYKTFFYNVNINNFVVFFDNILIIC